MAAYIDLNPVRAGVVEDPKDYPWSSYGAAVGGNKEGVAGIRALWGGGQSKEAALAKHRLFLFEEGSDERVPKDGVLTNRVGIDARKVWEERTRGGRLPLPVMLRLRERYLTDGAIVGSKEFVEKMTERREKGKSGVAMRFGEWGGLHALRNLRTNLIS